MKQLKLKYLRIFIVATVMLLGSTTIGYGQYISGTSVVTLGQSYTYYLGGINVPRNTNWSVPYGGVVTSSTSTQATVHWTTGVSVVLANCFDYNNNFHSIALPITQATTAPSTPPAPTVQSSLPGSVILQRTGTPPTGVTWYWQSTSTGTSTSTANSGSTITLTTGSIYYLRANQSGTWSTTSSSVAYTIPPLPISPIFSDENYIYTITPQIGVTDVATITANEDAIKNITYFDGLGRPMQSIGIGQSGQTEKDIITHIGYDAFGRQDKDWLPYVPTNGDIGSYRTNDQEAATKSYYTTHFPDDINSANPNPYSEKELEASPLNRVLQQAAPGYDWRLGGGHEIDFDYQTNVTSEVRLYKVTTVYANNTYTPSLALGILNGGYYTANELYKTITYDENHSSGKNNSTEEFKDKQGRVVLKRTYATINSTPTPHDTYYVYDDFGNLSYVLPPKSEAHTSTPTQSVLDELCYQYTYDQRNRLVEKKIPGKEKEYIVYNKLDQPILTQDANLKASGKWLFTKYDAFGRVAYTGLMTRSILRKDLQTEANGISSQFVAKSNTSTTIAGTTIYYNNGAFPINNITELYTINYYDNYTFDKVAGNSESSYGVTPITNAKGLATGSKVRVLNSSPVSWITNVNYYDDKARPIYGYSNNAYLGTTDKVKSEYDFIKVIETTTTHAKTGKSTITITDKFYYDHVGRLTKQDQVIGSHTETIASNSYDELGQLITKKVGNTTANPLQTVDYAYNIRGWLKEINNLTSLGTDLFSFKINYNTVNHNATALFNGNISETEWRTSNTDNSLHWYKYNYDALNRLTSAVDNYGKLNETLTYDKNGNINNLVRLGHIVGGSTIPNINNSQHFGTMDNLVYTYETNSNKLKQVLDNANDTYGFKDSAVNDQDYWYDANGNMTKDDNKGITAITYNHLNLPTKISFGASNYISYFYDATGVKLKKKVTEGITNTETLYAGNFVYTGNNLQFFNQPEGYVELDASGGYDYVYQYKDHLGNIRLSYSDKNGNGTILVSTDLNTNEIVEENNYYPFGLKHKGYNNNVSASVNSVAKKFKYNGVELEESFDLNLYEMPMRQYDPAIGRFTSIDPVTNFTQSTYTAFDNNPIFWADPSGAYSTREWMKDNGITDDDVTTIYQAPNDDDGDSSDGVDDWFVNKKTGEVHHDSTKKEGDEKDLGDNWEHLAKEDEIDAEYDAVASENKGVTYSLEEAIKLMSQNGRILAPRKVLRDIAVRNLFTTPNTKIEINITQTNITEIWFDLTYVKKTAVPFNTNFNVLQDISFPQGYRQYQKLDRSYSNNIFKRVLNYGKSIHRKGSEDSAGSSLNTFIGWKNYDGPLLKFK